MDPERFCLVCKRKNLADAKECAYCGAPLKGSRGEPITTVPVYDGQPDIVVRPSRHLHQLAKLPPSALVLFVMDEEQPLVLSDSRSILLGRDVTNSTMPAVDLTKYGAVELGVSRKHALITSAEGAYTLQDLGSTNGTWLNERRLAIQKPYPLQSGDYLRLGKLRLYVYFRSATLTEDIILLAETLHPTGALRPRLTPYYLATVVSPYLQAIVDLQTAVDECQGRPPHEMGINTISAVKPESPLGLSVSGVTEAVRLIREWVAPWRKTHAEQLANLLAAQAFSEGEGARAVARQEGDGTGELPAEASPEKEGAAPSRAPRSEAKPASPEATRVIRPSDLTSQDSEQIRFEFQAHLARTAAQIVGVVAPDIPEADRPGFAQKLVPPLLVLATSPLEIFLERRD